MTRDREQRAERLTDHDTVDVVCSHARARTCSSYRDRFASR